MDKSLVIQNMFLHYSPLIRKDCSSIGADDMSRSIFESLNTDNNKYHLSEEECSNSKNILGEILDKIYDKYTEWADKHFGKNYSDQIAKYDKLNQVTSETENSSEKVLKQNLTEAKDKIKKFAAEHPENTRINDIANLIEDVDISVTNGITWYVAVTFTDSKEIKFSMESENLDPTTCLKSLIHEMAHYLNGDVLSSVPEEVDVESFAIDMAEQIDNVKYCEDKEAYMAEFESRYKYSLNQGSNYGQNASPGYNGLPLNAGFVINDDILSSVTTGKETVIKVAGEAEYHITWSDEVDENGNPYPAKVIKSAPWPFDDHRYEGLDTFNIIYKDYDKKAKSWNGLEWADRGKYKKLD